MNSLGWCKFSSKNSKEIVMILRKDISLRAFMSLLLLIGNLEKEHRNVPQLEIGCKKEGALKMG